MDDMEDSTVRCANPDCRVAESGRCIEGIVDLDSCTHYGRALVILDRPTLPAASELEANVLLPEASALVRPSVQLMLRHRPCNVISIVGPVGSGKTSLIAGAYDLFQQGPVDGFSFAGSSTLHSFERACHDTRRESKRKTPMMERTPTGDATFFHLDLVQHGCTGKLSALLANRSGEDYMEVQTTPTQAEQFFELHRADTITVLADGEDLLDTGLRHQVKRDICLTLRAFRESGSIYPWQRLAVVLTKLDAVRDVEDKTEQAMQCFERILADVRHQFATHFMEIRSFHVAASPQSEGAKRGEGMIELLRYWMSEPGRLQPAREVAVPASPTRAFGKLVSLARNSNEQ